MGKGGGEGGKAYLENTKNCLSDITRVISKLIAVLFRKSPGNISYSTCKEKATRLDQKYINYSISPCEKYFEKAILF